MRAFVCGCLGTRLTEEERAFVRDADPWGLILFKRNVESREQLRALTAEFRDAVGRADAPVLIDQEGGRVQRLAPPHWAAYPAAARFDAELGAAEARGRRRARHAADRPRSARGRHHRRLRAGARRRRRGDPCGDRLALLWPRPRARRGARARGDGGPQRRRRRAGRQAHPRSRPGARRQPPRAAGGHSQPRRACNAISRRSGRWPTRRRR